MSLPDVLGICQFLLFAYTTYRYGRLYVTRLGRTPFPTWRFIGMIMLSVVFLLSGLYLIEPGGVVAAG